MSFHNNIHIAILGPVSAGKSTFLNSLFSNTFSDMKRKKTTMLPQIYKTTSDKAIIHSTDEIYQMNHESNERILKLREENKYTQTDFKELVYNVAPIPDFINLPDKTATYSILDMPGLNCGGGDNMYFNYIQSISKDIDIYILVFDINSGLNTTDEVNILTMIAKEIEKNKHGFVHIIINKCDDVEYTSSDKFRFQDEELQELYDRCIEISDKYLKDTRGKITISPLCSSNLYVFRGTKNNIDTIDEKHLDKIIINECGKPELMKLKTIDLKRKFITGLITNPESTMYCNWMESTGYYLFQQNLNEMLKMSNYIKIVEHHILINLMDILAKPITNFDETSSMMVELNLSIQQLASIVKKYIVPDNITTIIKSITMKLDDYLTKGIDTYTGSTVETADSFIDKISNFFSKIKNLFTSNPLEIAHEKLHAKRISLLNNQLALKYDEKIFKELVHRKLINMDYFKQSVANTLMVSQDSPYVTNIIIDLITSISNICDNNSEYLNIILQRFQELPISNMFLEHSSDYIKCSDKPEYHKSFCDMITLIAKHINVYDEIGISHIINLLSKYFKPNHINTKGVAENMHADFKKQLNLVNYWITSHFTKINNAPKEVGYVYYVIKSHLHTYVDAVFPISMIIKSFEGFNNMNNRMERLFKTLFKIYTKNMELEVVIKSEPDVEIVNTDTVLTNYETSGDVFKDADDEMDEQYRDTDDAPTVYKKATHNAQTRMRRTLKFAN